MKNLIGILLACIIFNSSTFAGNYTWSGSTNTSWGTSSNWSPSGVPGSSDTININSTTNSLTLTAHQTVKRLVINSGVLNLGGDTLTITTSTGLNGGTINNGLFNANCTALVNFNGTAFGAVVKAKGQIKLNGCVFNSTASFEHIGSAAGTGSGGNTFNGVTTLKNSGTTTLRLAGTNADTFNNDVIINNVSPSGSGYLQLSYGAATYFNGNIEISSTSSYGIGFSSQGDGSSTLATGKAISIGSAGFVGTLVIQNFTQTGSTAQTLSISSVLNITNSTFNGAFTSTSTSILLSGCTFNNLSSFTKTGTSHDYSAGGNHFNNNSTFTNSSSTTAKIRLAASSGDTYSGDATFNTSNGLIEVAYVDTTIFQGNVTINNSKVTFNNSSGIVMCTGAVSQEFRGSADYKIGKLIMNKTANGVALEKAATIDSVLTLTAGIINTDTTNLLTLKAGGVSTGASSLSYIDGPMKKIGNTAFEFPVGKEGELMQLLISAPTNITDSYVAEYFSFSPLMGDSVSPEILSFIVPNYWKLNRTQGNSNVKVKLGWSKNDYHLGDTALIKIAVLHDTVWKGLYVDNLSFNDNGGFVETKDQLEKYSFITVTTAGGGLDHSGVICQSNEVMIWGLYNFAQHGDCGVTRVPTKVLSNPTSSLSACNVAPLPGPLTNVIKLSTGGYHNSALLCNGTVYSWGLNDKNQLGNPLVPLLNPTNVAVPVIASNGLPLAGVIDVASGVFGSIALLEDGRVLQWGVTRLELATNTSPNFFVSNPIPAQVTFSNNSPLTNVIAIAAGASHYVALIDDGSVYSWGRNLEGQLGVGSNSNNFSYQYPQIVKLKNVNTNLSNITKIAAGSFHNLAIDINGKVYSWGDNSQSQLGWLPNNYFADIVTSLSNITAVGAGGFHSLAVTNSGGIRSWGYNFTGQCGNNTVITPVSTPTNVLFTGTAPIIVSVYGGDRHSIALTADGRVYGFGDDSDYQLALQPAVTPSINCGLVTNYCISPIAIDITGIPQPNSNGVCEALITCDHEVSYCSYNEFITSDVDWTSNSLPDCYSSSNTTLLIENEIRITRNNTLTIKSGITIKFGPNGRIVLEEGTSTMDGAQLILESGSVLTAVGDCMWKGIEVRGDKQYPSNSTRQAKLIVEPGALIEHAHNGVLLGKWNAQYYNNCSDPIWTLGQTPFDLNGSGGVIDCNNATFQNNAIDIRFAPFSKFVNFSKIRNSATHNGSGFLGGQLRDKRYLLIGSPLYFPSPYFAPPNSLQRASISIYNLNNNGIQIEKNTFSDYNTGIYAVDARNLKIESCDFDNQIYGIRSEFTNSTVKHPGIFISNSFIDVEGQIYLKGGRNDVIRTNNFNRFNQASGTQNDNFVGVYLNNSIGYRIVDNDFYRLTYGVLGLNSGRNFGSLIGYETKGNIFNTTMWPIGLRSNNAGLQIKCNTYNNPDASLYDKNWFIGSSSPMSDQGMQSLVDEKLPAGNLFATSNRKQIFSASNNLLFTYFRHGGNTSLPIAPVAAGPINIDATSITFNTLEGACVPEPPCDPPCDERINLQVIKSVIDSLIERKDVLNANLDNQNQDGLIAFIRSPYSKDSLLNYLLNSSPLSDTIISLAINCIDSLPDANLELVLAVNSPLSTISWQYLDARSPAFDEQSYERIFSLQGYNSPYETVTMLEKNIKSFWNNYYLELNDYFRRLSEQDSILVMIDFLKASGTTYNLEQAFSIYLANEELDSANILFEQISIREDVESDWLTLNGILLDLSNQEKSIFEIDSIQLSNIEEIAFQEEESPSKANAESILTLLTWVDFEYSLPEENGNRLNGSSYGTSNNSKFELLKIAPNPANNEVIISGYSNSIQSLEIRDISSKIIDIESIQNLNGNIKMNVSKLNAGIYFVKIVDQNNNIKVGKFMVAR